MSGRSKDYLFWCSEGCGFVSENHRCEQWSDITYIPPECTDKIRLAVLEELEAEIKKEKTNWEIPYDEWADAGKQAVDTILALIRAKKGGLE